jgi:hypothetical protein
VDDPAEAIEAARGGGRPLEPAVQHRLEHAAGAGLGDVRIHTDASAARLADGLKARAFTTGRDIFFAAGAYDPGSPAGLHTLAHEATHVAQQAAGPVVGSPHGRLLVSDPADPFELEAERAAGAVGGLSGARSDRAEPPPPLSPGRVAVQRQPAPPAPAPPAPGTLCSLDQTRIVAPAVGTAQGWLATADTRLSAFLAAPASAASSQTGLTLLRNFKASDADIARFVQNRIRLIAQTLRTDPGAPNALTVECHGATDLTCGAAGAYVQANHLVFCPSFFAGSAAWRVTAMVHEIAHSLPDVAAHMHITDRAYEPDRLFAGMSPQEAVTNAESYALFVREINTGFEAATAPRDRYTDCPTPWRTALTVAEARAQRWARDAQTLTGDRRPGMLSQWTAVSTRYLGGQTTAQLDAAKRSYDATYSHLYERIPFQCETDSGGRCARYDTYWYALFSDFHICPSWLGKPSDDDRAEALLSGLLGFWDIEGSDPRRTALAALARALHYQFWAPPTAAEATAAMAATTAGAQPPAAPAPGPLPQL